jgi:hypothetical protein
LIILQILNNGFEATDLYRLRDDLVETTGDSSINVSIFGMPSDCHYDRLTNWLIEQILSDLLSGFKPIHYWHIQVHQYQIIIAVLHIVCLHVIHNTFNSLLPVVSEVWYLLAFWDLNARFKNDHGSIDVERLIIYD